MAAGAGAATPLGSVGATSTDPTPGGKCLKHQEYTFGKVLGNSIISLNCTYILITSAAGRPGLALMWLF